MPAPRMLLLNEEVCFRYRVITAVRALELGGTGRSEAVRLVAQGPHVDEAGSSRIVTERTLYRWLAAHAAHDLAGLSRKVRARVEGSQVLPPALLAFLATERDGDRDASVPELLRRAELREVIPSARALDRSTVWRAMQRLGIETRRRKIPIDADQRRFRYPSRMQMTLADFKHFRAGVVRVKRAAIYLLDDASRYGLDVLVTTSEQAAAVLHVLHEVICAHGLMDLLYWDHGPGFRDQDVLAVCAALGVGPLYGRARYPEGHGAIERFNRSAKARVLRALDGAPDVDVDCAALTLRLRHDLFEVYNHLPHEALDGQTPHQRFHQDPRPLRPAPSADWLRERFTVRLERRVSKDHIVPVDGVDYEVPRGHGGEKVVLVRRLLERTDDTDALYLRHQDKLVRLHPVDLALNARTRRAPRPDDPGEVAPVPAKSASQLAFERDLPSMLAPDGGYPATETPTDQSQTETTEKDPSQTETTEKER
jgi:transposase InsO family protein